jgi:energy-coupling factor transporter ATP-binding protein EcfA2
MTPIEQIAQWIDDKPVWWKHTVRLVLEHGELERDHFNEIYSIARMSHGLEAKTEEYTDACKPISFTGYTQEQGTVLLAKLTDVEGVGALAKDQSLTFSKSGLHVVYGDNGAGKSSYVSILKNACLTRGEKPKILGNVFEKIFVTPSAKIFVENGGDEEEIEWSLNCSNLDTLKSIRVFDSESAHHYLNKEDTIGFKPMGLNLLTEIARAISQIKAIVDEDIMPGNGITSLQVINSNSFAANFVNSLSDKTDEEDLQKHKAKLGEEEKIEPLRKEILEDQAQSPETKRAALVQQNALLTPLLNYTSDLLRYLGDKAFDRLLHLYLDYSTKQEKADEIKKATLNNLPLDTVTGISWQTLWNAAKTFIEQEPKLNNFPLNEGDACPLCLQDISASTEKRLESLGKFLKNHAALEAKEAYKLLQNAVTKISAQTPSFGNYKAALIELEKFIPGSEKQFNTLLQQLTQRKPIFSKPSELPETMPALNIEVLEELKQKIELTAQQIEGIKSDADLLSLVQKKQDELQHLIDRQFILKNHDVIVNNIRRHKIVSKMGALGRECNTRPISTLSSQINQEGTVKPLVSALTEELKQFGFIRFTVNAKTRNRSGHQQFKLEIEDAGESIAKIASEGEQRCIAIAAFLAELKAEKRKSAIIFDDPVNSLSHQWRSRVADRLVSESFNRQVVVFTHDIVFYKLLLEAAEAQDANHGSNALERSRRGLVGIVRDSAPWEALTTTKRIKVLNNELRDLKKIDQNGTDEEFRRLSREFYGRLRESWERLVEEKLLNKVVNRFERGVQTQRLKRLTDITDADITRIDDAMSKCSTYFTGHDSAPAIGDPHPTIEEVEKDLATLDSFNIELQTKRKRSN